MTSEEKINEIVKELMDRGASAASRVGEHIEELCAYDTDAESILICAVDLEEMAEYATEAAKKMRAIL